MNVAVYCASRENLGEKYEAPAIALGKWLGENGHTLVYGGVKSGLMHTVAQAAHDAGAHIVGVVPERFVERTDAVVDEVVKCHDLGDRKVIMMDRADAFVVLPGGLGTLDEWLSTLSQIIVNIDDHRPIFVVNVPTNWNNCATRQTRRSPEASTSTALSKWQMAPPSSRLLKWRIEIRFLFLEVKELKRFRS